MFKEEAIALVKDHKQIQEVDDALDKLNKETSEQLDFIKKKADQIANKAQARKEALWQEVKDYLKEKELLPDWYNSEHHGIAVNRGAICIMDRRNNSGDEGMLGMIARAMSEGRGQIVDVEIDTDDDS